MTANEGNQLYVKLFSQHNFCCYGNSISFPYRTHFSESHLCQKLLTLIQITQELKRPSMYELHSIVKNQTCVSD